MIDEVELRVSLTNSLRASSRKNTNTQP
jgi:hypothetical protein